MLILLFPRVSCRQALSFPTSPARCQKGTRKSGWKGESFTMIQTRAWPQRPQKKEVNASNRALLLLEGNMGFEERIKEALILALHLGELISLKYFLGAHANQSLGHILCKGHRKSQAPGESWAQLGRASKSLQEQAGRAESSGDAACREGGDTMHRGRGLSSSVSITDGLRPPQKGTQPHLSCHKPSNSDPLRKELRAAREITGILPVWF